MYDIMERTSTEQSSLELEDWATIAEHHQARTHEEQSRKLMF